MRGVLGFHRSCLKSMLFLHSSSKSLLYQHALTKNHMPFREFLLKVTAFQYEHCCSSRSYHGSSNANLPSQLTGKKGNINKSCVDGDMISGRWFANTNHVHGESPGNLYVNESPEKREFTRKDPTESSQNGDRTPGKWFIDTGPVDKKDSKTIASTKTSSDLLASRRHMKMQVKGFVKKQYLDGKFHDLVEKVVANPLVLQIAYDSLILNLSISEAPQSPLTNSSHSICFDSLAKALLEEEFEIESNVHRFPPLETAGECLVLPNLKLKVVQEAIRMVLETIYVPEFSRISHSCKNERGQQSALKYISREVHNPDWFLSFSVERKFNHTIFKKLLTVMRQNIVDDRFFKLLSQMFDSNVLNVKFGDFPKGQGCIEEGILSPMLLNIYMDLFDKELYKITLHYEALESSESDQSPQMIDSQMPMQSSSKFRLWVLNRMKKKPEGAQSNDPVPRKLYACRYMDEIFVAFSGPKELAENAKNRIVAFLQKSLHLKVKKSKAQLVSAASRDTHFLGMNIRVMLLSELESPKKIPVRVVSKIADKLRWFAEEKQCRWEYLSKRLSKKWFGHALKKIRESERMTNVGMINDLNKYREPGRGKVAWFRDMCVIWLQDLDKQFAADEKDKIWFKNASKLELISKLIVQPELPKDLAESFSKFQDNVNEFLASEDAKLEALRRSIDEKNNDSSTKDSSERRTVIHAPIQTIKEELIFTRILNKRGHPQCFQKLVTQNDTLIIKWYHGVALRLISFFSSCRNFKMVTKLISQDLKMSCILTLAKKHRASEAQVWRCFAKELSMLRFPSKIITEPSDDLKYIDEWSFGPCIWLLSYKNRAAGADSCSLCSVACCNDHFTKLYSVSKLDFSSVCPDALHPNLTGKKIAFCRSHVKDLYLGRITFRDIDFTNLSGNSSEPDVDA